MKRRRYAIRNWLMVFLLAELAVVGTPRSVHADGPAEVVRKYCELDANGARLSDNGPEEFWTLHDQEAPVVEPGWDTVTLISRFEVGIPRMRRDIADVPVVFHGLGHFSDRFETDAQKTTVTFRVVHRADGWKIRPTPLAPHVYVRTIEQHLLGLRRWFNLPSEKFRIRKLLYEVFRAMLFEQQQERKTRAR